MNKLLTRLIEESMPDETPVKETRPVSEMPEPMLEVVEKVTGNIFAIGLFVQDSLGIDIPEELFDAEGLIEDALGVDFSTIRQSAETVQGLEDVIANSDQEFIKNNLLPEAFGNIKSALTEYADTNPDTLDLEEIFALLDMAKNTILGDSDDEPAETPDEIEVDVTDEIEVEV